MLRLLARTVLVLLANAVGLIAATLSLAGFSIDVRSFAIALAIFTGATVLLGPVVTALARRHASFLMGGIAIVTTLVGLVVTRLLSDGIVIRGLGTWVSATFVIWLFSVVATVVLPLFLFRDTLAGQDRRGRT